MFTILSGFSSYKNFHCLIRICMFLSGFYGLIRIFTIWSGFSPSYQDFHRIIWIFTVSSGFLPYYQDFHRLIRIFTVSSGFSPAYKDFHKIFEISWNYSGLLGIAFYVETTWRLLQITRDHLELPENNWDCTCDKLGFLKISWEFFQLLVIFLVILRITWDYLKLLWITGKTLYFLGITWGIDL